MSDDHSPNWNVIVQRHAERVFRIAYRIVGSVHDAEDVSQIVSNTMGWSKDLRSTK